MAQFVVTWSLFLFASCLTLTLSNGNVVLQQQAKVPMVNNNIVDGMDENGNMVVGGVGVDDKGERVYHPAAVTEPRIIEQYDHRALDGHYEYRYLLSNGDARYERAYWIPDGKNVVLARKGYYSYPLRNSKYLTVFYTADQNGYRQDSTTYSKSPPTLPRSIQVPEYVQSSPYATNAPPITQRPTSPHVYISTTTRKPYIQQTANPFIQLYPSPVSQTSIHHSGIGNQALSPYGPQSQQMKPSYDYSSSAVHTPIGGYYPSEAQSSFGHHHSTAAHSSTGIHSSSGAHHSAVMQSTGAYPSTLHHAGHSSGTYSSLSVPSSDTHASPNVHSSSSGHSASGVQSSSEAHSSSGVHSSTGVHSSSSGHSSSGVPPSSGVHSHAGIPSSVAIHPPSVAQNSLGVHYPSVASPSSSGIHSSAGGHSSSGIPTTSTGIHSGAVVQSSGAVKSPSVVHTSVGRPPSQSIVHYSFGTSSQTEALSPSGVHSSNDHHPSVSSSTQVYPPHQYQPSTHISTVQPTTASILVPPQSWHYNF